MKDIEVLREKKRVESNVFTPVFYRMNNEQERRELLKLAEEENIHIHDEMYGQLCELVKSRNPTRPLSQDDYNTLVSQHLNGTPLEEYGVWAYYSWTNRLVHILDEEEFIEVRTSRNQYKITNAERHLLRQKKVGVIGLSVGQSVSVTMAMERGCGELRLADFDILELTNYNRIRTGLHNLGIKKVVAVAREIMEIDPYLAVKCYSDGITEENIQSFIDDGTGKLDIIIDECDSVDIKILCRIKAREQHIPVVMEASDRGTIDVERFDLEPERPILHGRVDHLDLGKLKHLKTNEEKVPYILPIAGTDTLSTRMKASMLEVGRTITTWPQLASAVALGGGITADVCRRIFLDEYHDSGRYFIDIEQLICDKETVAQETTGRQAAISEEQMDQLIGQAKLTLKENTTLPGKELITELVHAGTLAPSLGNEQPWKWKFHKGILYQFLNLERPATISEKHAHISGLGAATENIVLQAQVHSLSVEVLPFPLGLESELVCGYCFCTNDTKSASEQFLADTIPYRSTNRHLTSKQPIAQERLTALGTTAEALNGARLEWLTDDEHIKEISRLTGKAEKIMLLDKQGHSRFVQDIVWNSSTGSEEKGIQLSSLGLRPSELVAYNMIKNESVRQYLTKWNTGSGLEWFGSKYTSSASAVGLLTMPAGSNASYFSGGRAMERVWLAANADGIAIQPLHTLPMLFDELMNSEPGRFTENVNKELDEMRKSYEKLFSLSQRVEIMLFRAFISNEKAERASRVPANKVLSFS